MEKVLHRSSLWTQFVKDSWPVYFFGIIAVLVTDIAQVFYTRSMGWVIDFFVDKKFPFSLDLEKEKQFLFIFLVLSGSRVIQTLGRMAWRITLARQTHKASAMLKNKVWENIRFISKVALQTKYPKGVLMNIANSDISTARYLFGFTLVGAIDVIFLGVFTIWAMLEIHLQFTLLTLISLGPLPFLIKNLSSREVDNYKEAQRKLDHFNEEVSQAVGSIRLQKVSELGKYWNKFLVRSADDYRKSWFKSKETNLLYTPYIGSSTIAVYIVLFSYGTYLVFNDQLSIGDFVAINGLAVLLQNPFIELGYIISEVRKGIASLKRIEDVYSAEKDSYLYEQKLDVESSSTVFSINNLSFKYEKDGPFILKNFSVEIKRGERIGITGAVGTGKTTLLDILSGLERELEGEVLFKGRKFNEYSHQSLRDVISLVHQKSFLFADTIKGNITLDRELSDEKVWHFLYLAGLDEDVKKFKDGLQTHLGEWGINLSGGQKQRLALARALSREPRVLLLDDCLSAVDTVTEESILSRLNEHLKDVTIIWVAHRKSTLKYCNRVLEL